MPAVGTAGKAIPLLIKQGCDFTVPLRVTVPGTTDPLDLTGHTVRAQIRKTVRSSAIAASFTPLIDSDPTTGLVALTLSATVTAAIPAGETRDSRESQYVWDAELVAPNGTVSPLAWGAVRIHPEVTRV